MGSASTKFAKQIKDGKLKDGKKGVKPVLAQGHGKKKGKKDKDKPSPNKFPEELKTLGAPANLNVPKVILGRSYWWCNPHAKWGLHKTLECIAKAEGAPAGGNPQAGGHNGLTIRAVEALIDARR